MRAGGFESALAIAIILTPWFYLRYGGFDFSVGTSFTLGDLFLSLALVIAMTQFLYKAIPINGYVRSATSIALAFLLSTSVSAIIGALGFFTLSQFELTVFISAYMQYAFVMIGFVLLGIRATNPQHIALLVGVGYLSPMVVTLILAIAGEMTSENSWFFSVNRAIGTYGNANSFAAVILIVLPLYIQLAIEGKSHFAKRVGILGLLFSGLCLFLTVSFSAWLVFAVVMIANIAYMFASPKHPLRNYRFRAMAWLLSIIAISPIIIMAFLTLFPEILQAVSYRLLLDRDVDASFETVGSGAERLELMRIAADELIDRSVGSIFFGHGLGQSLFFPGFDLGGIQVVVHNLPLLLWLDSGMFATLLFYAFVFVLTVAVFRTRKDHPLLALTVINSIAFFSFYTLFNPHYYLRYFWVPLLPAFSLASLNRKRD